MIETGGAEKLRFGRVISRTFEVLRRAALTLLVVGVLSEGLVQVVFAVLRLSGFGPGADDNLLAQMRGMPGEQLLTTLASLYFSGGALFIALLALRGRSTSIPEGFAQCGRHLWRMFKIAILTNIAVFLGLLLLIVPGLILWARWAAGPPACVAEKLGGARLSMGRSADLTYGSRARIIGLGLLGLIFLLVSIFLFVTVGSIIDELTGSVLHLADLVFLPVGFVFLTAFTSAGKAAIYDELVRIKEGGDVKEMAEVFA